MATIGLFLAIVSVHLGSLSQDSIIQIPVRVHLLHSSRSAALSTTLREQDAQILLDSANAVWHAAGIQWKLESVIREEGLSGALFDSVVAQQLAPTNERQLAILPKNTLLSPGWNLFLIHDYGQIAGGVFWPEVPGIVLAERGMGIDLPAAGRGGFTLAHELGHSLGLDHVPCDASRNILAVGCWRPDFRSTLTTEQIQRARTQAKTGHPFGK